MKTVWYCQNNLDGLGYGSHPVSDFLLSVIAAAAHDAARRHRVAGVRRRRVLRLARTVRGQARGRRLPN